MFGTGFRGALDGDAAWVADAVDAVLGPCVAVDIPSGVNGQTGAVDGEAVHASHTVTFSALKPGLVFEPGAGHAGEVEVADIGIDLGDPPVFVPELLDLALALPERAPDAHKWLSGALVVGGSGGMTGAPSFVSHAAMRAGAGIVWCGVPGDEAAAARVRHRGDHESAAVHAGRRARRARRRRGAQGGRPVPRPRRRPRARA